MDLLLQKILISLAAGRTNNFLSRIFSNKIVENQINLAYEEALKEYHPNPTANIINKLKFSQSFEKLTSSIGSQNIPELDEEEIQFIEIFYKKLKQQDIAWREIESKYFESQGTSLRIIEAQVSKTYDDLIKFVNSIENTIANDGNSTRELITSTKKDIDRTEEKLKEYTTLIKEDIIDHINRLDKSSNLNEAKSHPSKISLARAMKELFVISNRFVHLSYIVQAILFGVNIYLILCTPKETNSSIWGMLAISITVMILSIYLLYKSKKYYELGENARKMDMIERIFPNAANNTTKSYFISRLPFSVIEKAKKNPDEKTDYYTDRENKYEKLIENIQQNCYFTSEIMRSYSGIILFVLILMSILLAGSIVFGFFILSESNSDPQLSKSIAGYLALLINFVFTLNIVDHYILFSKKAKELKQIDETLNTIKDKPHEDEVITSFTEYNCILCDALPCPDFAYNRIKGKLNSVWINRVNND